MYISVPVCVYSVSRLTEERATAESIISLADDYSDPGQPPKLPSKERERDMFERKKINEANDRGSDAQKKVVCLAAVMINCVVCALMF